MEPERNIYLAVHGRETVGPVAEQDVLNDIRLGKVPPDTNFCPLGESEWRPLRDVEPYASAFQEGSQKVVEPAASQSSRLMDWLRMDLATGKPVRRNPSQGQPVTSAVRPEEPGYANLLAASQALRSYGDSLKLLGVVLGLFGCLLGAVGVATGSAALGVFGALFSIAVAIGMHASGTFIAASGEGLLALAEIAVNTRHRP